METNKSYVYFAFNGNDFDPNEITKRIGIKPTETQRKGDKGKYSPNIKYSSWKLSTEKGKETIEIYRLVEEIVNKLYDSIDIINELKNEYDLTSVIEIVVYIDINPTVSTPALGEDLKTIEFLYSTKTTTDIDIGS